MKELGVDQVYIDRMSGKSLNRPELKQMMEYVRKGDTVIVESISRFARNTRDLLELVEQLTAKGVEFISKKEGLDIAGLMNMLNKKSGVFGLSNNLSSDFRDLEEGANSGNNEARIALEVFAYRVAKYVGSYVAAMNGVDVIAFTAGIGENSGTVRTAVAKYLGYLGITIDEDANKKRGEEITISTADSKVKVMVIPTNEELAIARETVALV